MIKILDFKLMEQKGC